MLIRFHLRIHEIYTRYNWIINFDYEITYKYLPHSFYIYLFSLFYQNKSPLFNSHLSAVIIQLSQVKALFQK